MPSPSRTFESETAGNVAETVRGRVERLFEAQENDESGPRADPKATSPQRAWRRRRSLKNLRLRVRCRQWKWDTTHDNRSTEFRAEAFDAGCRGRQVQGARPGPSGKKYAQSSPSHQQAQPVDNGEHRHVQQIAGRAMAPLRRRRPTTDSDTCEQDGLAEHCLLPGACGLTTSCRCGRGMYMKASAYAEATTCACPPCFNFTHKCQWKAADTSVNSSATLDEIIPLRDSTPLEPAAGETGRDPVRVPSSGKRTISCRRVGQRGTCPESYSAAGDTRWEGPQGTPSVLPSRSLDGPQISHSHPVSCPARWGGHATRCAVAPSAIETSSPPGCSPDWGAARRWNPAATTKTEYAVERTPSICTRR